MKVLLVSEWDASIARAPGYGLRLRSLIAWMTADIRVSHSHYVINRVSAAPQLKRLARVLRSYFEIRRVARGFDCVVIAGLNSPHMSWLARRLAASFQVVLDVCDSVYLTQKSMTSVEGKTRQALTTAQARLAYGGSRELAYLYVSNRDLVADDRLRGSRHGAVVWPPVNDALRNLPPIRGKVARVVIPADLRSYHNRRTFDSLVAAMRSGFNPGVPVQIFGPLVELDLPPGMTFMGWAPNLEDVYTGETLVFAPNIDSPGIQNKVWEGLSANRPVVVGTRSAGDLASLPGVFTFDRDSDVIRALYRALELAPQMAAGASTELPSNDNPASEVLVQLFPGLRRTQEPSDGR